jgi:formylglycine-generating enzyme required for sulfatase activity
MPGRRGLVLGLAALLLLAAPAAWLVFAKYPETTPKDGDAACNVAGPAEVLLPGGSFVMGDKGLYREEGPPRRIAVRPFWIDTHEVTNAQFRTFVKATGYVTQAERRPDPADYPDIAPEKLVPGGAVFVARPDAGADPREWWRFVAGADWRHPTGPGSSIEGKDHYPVVQISWADARAYSDWAGRALPDEAQWEYAARGGTGGTTFAWGDQPTVDGKPQANNWQGVFPEYDSGEDGHAGLAPVGCYPANPFGLHDMIGNVWEWTSSAWTPDHSVAAGQRAPLMVIKGGSYLCADNYCLRYRPPARQPGDAGMGSSHIGFRTIRPVG